MTDKERDKGGMMDKDNMCLECGGWLVDGICEDCGEDSK